ncbi:MAG: rubrerythrin family protein [Actinobacteria bacterium]|nr:rubrerythrin family protein [Actinomycetota bacterium]
MSSLKGTQTEKNLLKAFAGESQARNRYTFFAKQAAKEGYEQIAALFLETAENEGQHAKMYFRHLEGGIVEITASYPAGKIGTTAENLLAAAEGENEEWTDLYPAFGDMAESEGFKDAAKSFRQIAKVEAWHEARYRRLLDNIEKDAVFAKPEPVKWICRKCGFVHEGPTALKVCPACDHPQAYQEVYAENF